MCSARPLAPLTAVRRLLRSFSALIVLLGGIPLAGQSVFSIGPLADGSGEQQGSGGVVSADILRHPIKEKTRRLLQIAVKTMNAGEHENAIRQLLDVLAKYPESAAYVFSLLGVEYLRTDRFTDAVDSFEQAIALLPHDATNRYNLAVSLLCNHDLERGGQEARRALELAPTNPTMRELVDAIDRAKSAVADRSPSSAGR
jgi:tetratricopeptide (TPR) repeat protein